MSVVVVAEEADAAIALGGILRQEILEFITRIDRSVEDSRDLSSANLQSEPADEGCANGSIGRCSSSRAI